MISCLCVTRGDRPALLAEAVGDFARQSHVPRELVILHDGGDSLHARLAALAARWPEAVIRIEAAPPGLTLGALRNRALAAARGAWVCQWDDDDRYHRRRLDLQFEAAAAEGADAAFLVDQLHWFEADALLCWDDWEREPYPLNLIQGTVLARRDAMPPYPDLPRGEDTLQTHALLRSGARIARLRGAGWCYVYRCHGGNVWDLAHHRAISAAKHLGPALLLPRLAVLRARLGEYEPKLPALAMPLGAERVAVTQVE